MSLRVQVLADQADPPVDRPAAQALVQTFLYVEVTSVDEPRPNAGLAPLTGPSYPVALRDAEEDVTGLWLALAAEVTHPIARARCWDIVFTLDLANKRDAAQQAIRAYLDTREADLGASDLARGLVRAWHVARQVGLADLAAKVAAAMIDVATETVDREEDPYAVIPLLSAPAPRDRFGDRGFGCGRSTGLCAHHLPAPPCHQGHRHAGAATRQR